MVHQSGAGAFARSVARAKCREEKGEGEDRSVFPFKQVQGEMGQAAMMLLTIRHRLVLDTAVQSRVQRRHREVRRCLVIAFELNMSVEE